MFQSFTGSSRRPRQVNLSGHNLNTRKNLSPAQNPHGAKPAGQAAIAQAQVHRLQRESDRKRLNATRVLQKSWRGHSSRQKIKQAWREEWDRRDLARREIQPSDVDQSTRTRPGKYEGSLEYDAEEYCYAQMRLLLLFVNVKLETDQARLASFDEFLRSTLKEHPTIAHADSWRMPLYRLSKLTLEALDSLIEGAKLVNTQQPASLVSMLLFLSRLMPGQISRSAERYYSVLAKLLSSVDKSIQRCEGEVRDAVLALLIPITSESLTAYVAFCAELLTAPDALVRLQVDGPVAPMLNYEMLIAALEDIFKKHTRPREIFTRGRTVRYGCSHM